jgi:hypothetical protein
MTQPAKSRTSRIVPFSTATSNATAVIEVDVHRRDQQIMMIVRGLAQALRQFASLMIIKVDECRHARLSIITLSPELGNTCLSGIADRIRSVLVPALFDAAIMRRNFWAAKTCSTRARTRARVALPRAMFETCMLRRDSGLRRSATGPAFERCSRGPGCQISVVVGQRQRPRPVQTLLR